MTGLHSSLKKEIVRNLHSAIDNEMANNDEAAYGYYIEGLRLVADALITDISNGGTSLSLKEKQNLIEFAKQSIGRVSLFLKKEDHSSNEVTSEINANITPSAPSEQLVLDLKGAATGPHLSFMPDHGLQEEEEERNKIILRYRKRLDNASGAVQRQNLELELARQLVEKAAITRNRMMQATAWAMQNAHMKFHIPEKLKGGTLKESDFRKQQLYALALYYTEGNSWLKQCAQDLNMYPSNEKFVRELLCNILTDNEHPVRCSLINMQSKVQQMLSSAETVPLEEINLTSITDEIKDDLNILQDVLKVLFEPLATERNSQITSEVVYNIYFSPLKAPLISVIRKTNQESEQAMKRCMETGCKEGCQFNVNEDLKREALTKLHYLTTLHSPYDMIDCTVYIMKLLTKSDYDKNHITSIGADDLLPRLCSLVLQSRLVLIAAETKYMETFMPSEKALGEEGYAVTMLGSVLEHFSLM